MVLRSFRLLCAVILGATSAACVIDHGPELVRVGEPGERSRSGVRAAVAVVRPNVAYSIHNVFDDEAITGPKVVNDHHVGVDDDRGRPSQTWTPLSVGGRAYQLQVNDTRECLADHGAGVVEEPCDPLRPDQHWLIVQHAGHHEILFRDTSNCLAITARGKLVDAECHGEAHQLWDFVPRTRS